ncbi:hypothetical protein J1605_017544 [Eschrichtius robustus]|uniref:Uncharacterized protein n=1 Tax=Eschrichtius robustus TaxID=9764 RepID=A0AB34I2J7_ESCRO|nr:hypothetical protein J1605_017544 [Eschrichtius robustus]
MPFRRRVRKIFLTSSPEALGRWRGSTRLPFLRNKLSGRHPRRRSCPRIQASGCRGGNAPNPQLPRGFESFVALPSGGLPAAAPPGGASEISQRRHFPPPAFGLPGVRRDEAFSSERWLVDTGDLEFRSF